MFLNIFSTNNEGLFSLSKKINSSNLSNELIFEKSYCLSNAILYK